MPERFRPHKFFACTLLIMALLLGSHYTRAQQKLFGSNLLLETRINYGFLVNHHLEMKIFNAHFPSFEVNLGKETFGQERWQVLYGYPIIGLSYWFSHMGNSQYLGSANALFPYVNYPLLRTSRQELNFRVGLGLAYLTKRFDRLENYKYVAIGSHLNAAVNLMVEYRYRVSPRLNLAAGLALMHFSNGSTKTPNYGINSPSLNLAAAYRLSKENPYLNRKMLPGLFLFEFDGKRFIDLSAATTLAYKDMGSEYGRQFMIYNFFADITYPLTFKSSAGIGFDITHDESDKFTAELKSIEYEKPSQLIRVGINGAYRLSMSNLHYMFNLGYYVGGRVHPTKSYFKIGLQYDITHNLFVALSLRTHFAQADFVGIGIGYRMPYYYLKIHKNTTDER